MNYKDKIILITGAAHGIGLSLAKLYHNQGAKVVAWDINEEAITNAKAELPNSSFYKCDVTSKDQVYNTAKCVIKDVGVPYVLINNAGVVENSYFLDCPDELLDRTIDVNIKAHFWILKAFLPAMIEKGEGHLCQVASAAGIMGVKGLAGYCASKHAAVGFANALRLELNDMAQGKIGVTIVCPSFINTGMFAGVKAARFTPLLDQEKIAKIIFKAVAKKKNFVLEPFMVKTVPLLNALLPTTLFNRTLEFFKVNDAMDEINKGSH